MIRENSGSVVGCQRNSFPETDPTFGSRLPAPTISAMKPGLSTTSGLSASSRANTLVLRGREPNIVLVENNLRPFAPLFENFARPVGRGIVNDNDFYRAVGLPSNGGQAGLEKWRRVVSSNENRNHEQSGSAG